MIRQNILVFAFFVNFLGIALTAWVMPTWSDVWLRRSPVAAALFHQIGSVLVLLNAMRLLWFEALARQLPGSRRTGRGGFRRPRRRLVRAAGTSRSRRLATAPTMGAALAAALVLVYFSLGITVVQPDEVAVVQRCGRFAAVLGPGLYLACRRRGTRSGKIGRRSVQTIEIGLRAAKTAGPAGPPSAIEWNSPHADSETERREDEAVVMTGDQSLVEMAASVQYRVRDVRAYRFRTARHRQTVAGGRRRRIA